MNPFTRSLLREVNDKELADWVQGWDELETMVVEIYRTRHADREQSRTYDRLRRDLTARYRSWQQELTPHWRGLKAGGTPVTDDPFQALLAEAEAASFVDNWRAMEILPAAREALNSYLIARIESAR
jgi:hypothetical protein